MRERDFTCTVPWRIAVWQVFTWSTVSVLRSTRTWIAGLLLLLPAVFGYHKLIQSYLTLGLLPLAALILASSLIVEERERGTLVYLLTRPIARWTLFLGKFASYGSAMMALILAAMTVGALQSTIRPVSGPVRLPSDLGVMALAVIAYGALFALLGVSTKRPVVWGLLFLFVWEKLTLLPGAFPRLTLTAHLQRLLGSDSTNMTGLAQSFSLSVVLIASAAALFLAAWIVSWREFVADPGRGAE